MSMDVVMRQRQTPYLAKEEGCQHCGKPLELPAEEQFCCRGCATAFSFIKNLGLTQYYNLRKSEKEGGIEPFSDVDVKDFTIYDNWEFQKDFVVRDKQICRATLLVEQLDCYACVWLCEQVVARQSQHASLHINYAKGEGLVTFEPEHIKLSTIVAALAKCGFPVKKSGGLSPSFSADLIRIGVAAFCTMNIMIFAFADYLSGAGDMSSEFWQLFRILSLLFCSLCLFVSASPLFKSALRALKLRQLHIDQPISLGLLGPYGYSVANTFQAKGEVYYDSVSAIITLLLVGRFFQKKFIAKAEAMIRSSFQAEAEFVRKIAEDQTEALVNLQKIAKGDRLKVLPGDMIPVSALLLEGQGDVSFESINGEPEQVWVQAGARLRAGAIVGPSPFMIQALEEGGSSYILRLRQLADKMLATKGRYSKISNQLALVYLIATLLVSLWTIFHYWKVSESIAIARTIAVLLVACPCAFGMAVPLTFANCAGQAIRRGIIFRSPEAIENLTQVVKVVFDKTGTLTLGQAVVAKVHFWQEALQSLELDEKTSHALLASCAGGSQHHAALAVLAWLKQQGQLTGLTRFSKGIWQEDVGEGVSYESQAYQIKLGKLRYCCSHPSIGIDPAGRSANVYASINGKLIAAFWLKDAVRPQAEESLLKLKNLGKKIALLSGDQASETLKMASQLGIDVSEVSSEASPLQKLLLLKSQKVQLAMVGNGLNDTLVLAKTPVSFAVSQASPHAKKVASICLTHDDLTLIPKAFEYSYAATRRIKYILTFSVLYNAVAIMLAVLGYVNPLVAAILMPINSLTVVGMACTKI